MSVFVLESRSGEYSDYCTSLEGVFSTRDKALVGAAAWRAIGNRPDTQNWVPASLEPNSDGYWELANSYSEELHLHEFILDKLEREL